MDDWILGDLVTGENGFVGRSHCAEWLWQEHAIRATVNSANVGIVDFERVIVGSINKGALEGDLVASKNKTCAVDLNEMRAVWSQGHVCNGLNQGRFLMTEISAQETTFTPAGTRRSAGEWWSILIGLLSAYTTLFPVITNGYGILKSRCVARLSLLCSSTIQVFLHSRQRIASTTTLVTMP